MFNLLRARLGALRMARNPIMVQSTLQQPQNWRAMQQGVRIGRAPPKPRHLVVSIIGIYLMYDVFTRVVLPPLDRLLDEVDAELDQQDKASGSDQNDETPMEGVMDSVFFAFPLTIKEVIPPFYTRFDPEFAQYLEIMKDKELRSQILKDAPEFVARKAPGYRPLFAGLRLVPGQSMIDLACPRGPPSYYVQSGLEFGDGFVAWTTMPIDPQTALRTRRILYPKAAALSAYNYLRVLFSADPNAAAGAATIDQLQLKLPTGYPARMDNLYAQSSLDKLGLGRNTDPEVKRAKKAATKAAIRVMEEQEKILNEKLKTLPSDDEKVKDQKETGSQSSLQMTRLGRDSTAQRVDTRSEMEKRREELKELFPTLAYYSEVLTRRLAWARFTAMLTWKNAAEPIVAPPPRGAVRVDGVYSLPCKNPGRGGYLLVQATMWWDPVTKKFDEDSFECTLLRNRIYPIPPGMKKRLPPSTGQPTITPPPASPTSTESDDTSGENGDK